MVLTVLRNDPAVPVGHLGPIAAGRGIDIHLVRLDAGDPLPQLDEVEALVVLGGEMGVYDTESYPYLVAEIRFLRDAVAIGTPILGICLGCQLLASALGGSAHRAESPEYRIGPITTTDDAVVSVLGTGPSWSFHRDTWDIPPGAKLVGRTEGYNHAFRSGSALGIQSHPEVTQATLDRWLGDPAFIEMAEAAGTDTSTIATDFLAAADAAEDVANKFFNAWLDEASM